MQKPLEYMPNPDEVGSAEYRLVHDYVTELEEQGFEPLLIQASLDELSRDARKFLMEYTRLTNTF